MKDFKNGNNELFAFENDCFDEDGKCINEYALKVIEENNLIEITHEESEVIRNYKSPEQIVEEEKLAKLPTSEEILNDKITLKALELIAELGLV